MQYDLGSTLTAIIRPPASMNIILYVKSSCRLIFEFSVKHRGCSRELGYGDEHLFAVEMQQPKKYHISDRDNSLPAQISTVGLV